MGKMLMTVAIPKKRGRPVKLVRKRKAFDVTVTERRMTMRGKLTITLFPVRPTPDDDGKWTFACAFPLQGTAEAQVRAATAKEARKLLEDYLFNELESPGTIE